MDRPARRASSFLQHLLELALLPDFLSALLRHLLLSLQQALEGSPDFLAALLCHLDFLAALLCHLLLPAQSLEGLLLVFASDLPTISVHATGVALNLKSHTARVLNAFLPMVHVGTLHSLPATAVWAAHRAPHHAFDTCSAFAAAAVAALCLDQLFTVVFALGALALGALKAR